MKKVLILLAVSLIIYGVSETNAGAEEVQSSPSYQLREGTVGPGGTYQSDSANFGSEATIGDTGVGDGRSANYRSAAGTNTTDDPQLVLIINTSSLNFGTFSSTTTATGTSSFSVLNYTANGYNVYTNGPPPSSISHTLTGMTPATSSQVGVEQYGINLKANTSPISQGADPLQIPSGSFSFGVASTGYNTANNYKYVNGESVAESTQSSGETDYTISYIINVSTATPAGQYAGSQGLIVVGSY